MFFWPVDFVSPIGALITFIWRLRPQQGALETILKRFLFEPREIEKMVHEESRATISR